MIILLLYLAWTMSQASADSEYLNDIERPNVDVVRQLNYVQRISNNQSGNLSVPNDEGMKNGSDAEKNLVNVSNGMSFERIDALYRDITGRTLGLCEFTCHKCYRCSLVYGELESVDKEGLFSDE
ncbi:MAG: hypothetical protein ACE5GV_01125 [Candidatus Scalindua sp.]